MTPVFVHRCSTDQSRHFVITSDPLDTLCSQMASRDLTSAFLERRSAANMRRRSDKNGYGACVTTLLEATSATENGTRGLIVCVFVPMRRLC